MPMTTKDFSSTNDIIRAHRGHYFDADTMRFFQSRVLGDVFQVENEVYFVTSERNSISGILHRRRYTVRAYNPVTDSIRTVQPFNELTRYRALRIARELAKLTGTQAI